MTAAKSKYDVEAIRRRIQQGSWPPGANPGRPYDPRVHRKVYRLYGAETPWEVFAWGLFDDLRAAHPGRAGDVLFIDDTGTLSPSGNYTLARATSYEGYLALLDRDDAAVGDLTAAGVRVPLPPRGPARWLRVYANKEGVSYQLSDIAADFDGAPLVASFATEFGPARGCLERFLADHGWPVRPGDWADGPWPVPTRCKHMRASTLRLAGRLRSGEVKGSTQDIGRVFFANVFESLAQAYPGRLQAGQILASDRRDGRWIALAGHRSWHLVLAFLDERVECRTYPTPRPICYADPKSTEQLGEILAEHDWGASL